MTQPRLAANVSEEVASPTFTSVLFYPEGGCSKFLRNAGNFMPIYTV